MTKFLCSGCGACCLTVGGKFGLPDRGDGVCANYNESTKKCNIYENRPEVCKMNKFYLKVKKYIPFMSEKWFYKLNTKACHILIDRHGLDNKYKISLKDYDVEQ
tara:strand:+ start:831 stop:1142 length:312 start_codon:yes stop_codon:yes gene_type:complete